jgi:hypothetical protein
LPDESQLQAAFDCLRDLAVLPTETQLWQVQSSARAAMKREQPLKDYKLLPYLGSASLIRAIGGREDTKNLDTTLGFSSLCPKLAEVEWVSGNHNDLVYHPHAVELAGVLKRIILRMQANPLVNHFKSVPLS